MTVYVFGNPDVDIDALPLRILPELKRRLPDVQFVVKDPNEDWEVPEELVVIDTVVGLDQVQVFEDIDKFVTTPRITMHGFDALMNLKLLQKIGKLKKLKIIGIPPTISEEEALNQLQSTFKKWTEQLMQGS